MKLETLVKIWNEKTGGTIFQDFYCSKNEYRVSYKKDGKLYTHNSKSVHALASKLNCIPALDWDKPEYNAYSEAQKIIDSLKNNIPVTSNLPISDTIRYMINNQFGEGYYLICTTEGYKTDEYDREISYTTYHDIKQFSDFNEYHKYFTENYKNNWDKLK